MNPDLLRYYDRMVDPRPIRARTRPEWLARRTELRQQVRACLGLDPAPARLPLDAHVGGTLEREGYRLERVFFQTWPGLYAGGWLYVPDPSVDRAPAILSPHGHFRNGAMDPVVQTRCITLARKGYVALAVDSVHTYRYDVGVNAVGVMTWNNMRALDYLCSRPEVDRERIGCVGESGGGQQTMYLMALDDRVKVAVPAVLVSYFKRILAPAPLHCPCNHVPGLMRVADEPEICALFAPRPLLFLTVTGDWTASFPAAEYGEIQNVYHLWGQLDRLEHSQFQGGHDFTLPMRERAYAWFNRWLKGIHDPHAALEGEVSVESVETLSGLSSNCGLRFAECGLWEETGDQRSTTNDQRPTTAGRPASGAVYQAARSPGDWVAAEATFQAPRLEGRDARKSYQARLRDEVTELLGGDVPTAVLEPELCDEGALRDGDTEIRWQAVTFRSEPEIRVPAWLWHSAEAAPIGPGIILVAPEGKTAWADLLDQRPTTNDQRRQEPGAGSREPGATVAPSPLVRALIAAGYRVLAVDPRLRGDLAADWFHNTVLWGRPEAGMAATDLQAAVGYLWQRGDVDRRAVALLGTGDMGVAALLAAGLDERVGVTIADCVQTTYQDGGEGLPVIPNLLRHADLPQLASLVAPRPLMLFRVPSERAGFSSRRYFDWARRSYQSLGAEDALALRAGTLPEPSELVRWLDGALRLRSKQKG
jgi:cephalosporin-C deacetylase-like acetyl esterase